MQLGVIYGGEGSGKSANETLQTSHRISFLSVLLLTINCSIIIIPLRVINRCSSVIHPFSHLPRPSLIKPHQGSSTKKNLKSPLICAIVSMMYYNLIYKQTTKYKYTVIPKLITNKINNAVKILLLF